MSIPSETTLSVPTDDPQLEEAGGVEKPVVAHSKGRIVIVMLSLSLALFLSALDITIISTALPTIASHFAASSADYAWVGSSYLISAAASTPLWGAFSNIWGRKPLLLLANVIFIAGSLVAALSQNIRMLIGGRIVQGIGGGGLLALVNICVADLFSLRERPKYYGIFGMVWAVAGGVGPIIGELSSTTLILRGYHEDLY
jgi:MFS family permease